MFCKILKCDQLSHDHGYYFFLSDSNTQGSYYSADLLDWHDFNFPGNEVLIFDNFHSQSNCYGIIIEKDMIVFSGKYHVYFAEFPPLISTFIWTPTLENKFSSTSGVNIFYYGQSSL
jgi:hypothetical protein